MIEFSIAVIIYVTHSHDKLFFEEYTQYLIGDCVVLKMAGPDYNAWVSDYRTFVVSDLDLRIATIGKKLPSFLGRDFDAHLNEAIILVMLVRWQAEKIPQR